MSIATLHPMASAEYYVMSQKSMRHPNDYYTAGVEPDGVWWNPSGLFNFSDGAKVNAKDFNRLYHGFDPVTGEKLSRNAGSKNRSPGLDITLNADKSVSALWALAPPELRAKIERAQEDAAREAIELTIARYCATTRHGVNGREVVPADILAALWQHGESRAGDPHLHTHCTLLNLARSHKDGKFRTLHQRPMFSTGSRPWGPSTATASPGCSRSASVSAWSVMATPVSASPVCRKRSRKGGQSARTR